MSAVGATAVMAPSRTLSSRSSKSSPIALRAQKAGRSRVSLVTRAGKKAPPKVEAPAPPQEAAPPQQMPMSPPPAYLPPPSGYVPPPPRECP